MSDVKKIKISRTFHGDHMECMGYLFILNIIITLFKMLYYFYLVIFTGRHINFSFVIFKIYPCREHGLSSI